MNRKLKHNSTGDWDFSDTKWRLDSADYTSPPSSLRKTWEAGYDATEVLVKTTTVPISSVKEGRIETYFKLRSGARAESVLEVRFRRQDADNYYFVRVFHVVINRLDVIIARNKAGATTTLWSGTASDIWYNVWHNLRVTWWNDSVGLVIRVEYWDGSNWVKIFDAYDSENNWKAQGGRVGFLLLSLSSWFETSIDDSIIYGIG